MERIICDTMIWYELSKNKLQVPDPEKYKLVCTYLSLTELAFTPNNFHKHKEVQDVIRKIIALEPDLILHYPLEHALAIIDSSHVPHYEIEEDLVMAFLRGILHQPQDSFPDNKFKSYLANISSRRKENSKDWVNFINKVNDPLKEVSSIVKKYHTKDSQQEFFRRGFLFDLNDIFEKSYTEESIDWKQFEFYEKVGQQYERKMIVSKMKADLNDENDLKNMLYVRPTDKYWTLEKRWLSIIKEIKLERYLYVQSP